MEFHELALANGALSRSSSALRLARQCMAAVQGDPRISASRRRLFERLFHGESEAIDRELTRTSVSTVQTYETVLGVLDSIELLIDNAELERNDRQVFYEHFGALRIALLDARARFEEIGL